MEALVMSLPNVTCLTATYNRHYHLERVVKMFIDQDYPGNHTLLIYNNNPVEQRLDNFSLPDNKKILVINCCRKRTTGEPYKNLGEIYNDALGFVPTNTDIITHMDDDDSYLPNHISEGVKGLQRAQNVSVIFKAYKPQFSWYRDINWNTVKAANTLEPSVFVLARHVREHGYRETTTDQHFGWYGPLTEEGSLYVDPGGTPTLIYQWMGDVFKTSGNPGHPQNWNNCRNHSGSTGDGIITPVSDEEIRRWYDTGSH